MMKKTPDLGLIPKFSVKWWIKHRPEGMEKIDAKLVNALTSFEKIAKASDGDKEARNHKLGEAAQHVQTAAKDLSNKIEDRAMKKTLLNYGISLRKLYEQMEQEQGEDPAREIRADKGHEKEKEKEKEKESDDDEDEVDEEEEEEYGEEAEETESSVLNEAIAARKKILQDMAKNKEAVARLSTTVLLGKSRPQLEAIKAGLLHVQQNASELLSDSDWKPTGLAPGEKDVLQKYYTAIVDMAKEIARLRKAGSDRVEEALRTTPDKQEPGVVRRRGGGPSQE
jgi:hypothetical protein